MSFCTFCNKEVTDRGHIKKCPNCGGQLHFDGSQAVCACCGQVTALDGKPKSEVPAEVPAQ